MQEVELQRRLPHIVCSDLVSGMPVMVQDFLMGAFKWVLMGSDGFTKVSQIKDSILKASLRLGL